MVIKFGTEAQEKGQIVSAETGQGRPVAKTGKKALITPAPGK